jgi:hypothetical protein
MPPLMLPFASEATLWMLRSLKSHALDATLVYSTPKSWDTQAMGYILANFPATHAAISFVTILHGLPKEEFGGMVS